MRDEEPIRRWQLLPEEAEVREIGPGAVRRYRLARLEEVAEGSPPRLASPPWQSPDRGPSQRPSP